jgi:hypothetical protein
MVAAWKAVLPELTNAEKRVCAEIMFKHMDFKHTGFKHMG